MKDYSNVTQKKYVDCILKSYGICNETSLNSTLIMEEVNNLSQQQRQNMKTFMKLCNVPDCIKCFKKYSLRVGFKPEVEFHPFSKVNVNLEDFLDPKLLFNDKINDEISKFCGAGDRFISIRDIFVSRLLNPFVYYIKLEIDGMVL